MSRTSSSLNRIGDDCYRLLLQYTQIQTMVAIHLISQRSYHATNHIATKYLPTIQLSLSEIDLCRCYSKTRMATIIPKLRLNQLDYSLFSIILCSKYLRSLDLSRNRMGLEGIRALAPQLASCPQLQTLNLDSNEIGNEGIRVLSPCLASCPQLQTLILSHNQIHNGIRVLASFFASCPRLQSLNLNWNHLGTKEMKVLVQGLSSIPQLQTLNLNGNNLDPEGMKVLASYLVSVPQLKTLNLGLNHLNVYGIKILVSHLASLPCLQALNLSNNCRNIEEMRLSIPHLASINVCPQLKTLNLAHGFLSHYDEEVFTRQLQTSLPKVTILMDNNYTTTRVIRKK